MSMTDPIADLLTRIRNAYGVRHDRLDVPASGLKQEICKILRDEGFIESFSLHDEGPTSKHIRIQLRYTPEGEPLVRRMQRVSRPGRRVYCKSADIKPVLNGLGVGIVSTSEGLLTDEAARQRGVGGEVLCEIW
jgi:small subunit ribosomal protein S8